MTARRPRVRRAAASGRTAGGSRGSVRLSGGRWKGRVLAVPRAARPTSARAREALFDLLGARLAGARCLELYAGSGAVGLEALSRGAARAVLVDLDADAAERNAAALSPPVGSLEILRRDAAAALEILARRDERFDFVFADPPYAAGVPPDVFELAAARLEPGGTFVLQTDERAVPALPQGLEIASRRGYGRNVFWFVRAARGQSGGAARF